jgi:S1-C subfamily serine protease
MEWRLKAASRELGSSAQLGIAETFLAGRASNVDAVVAYAWANIAAGRLGEIASPSRDQIAALLTPAERAEAERLSTAWKPGQIIVREAAGSARKDNALRGGVLEKYNTGTAFYVSRDGLAITNNHVVDGCKELRAAGHDGVLTIETADIVNDLALMRTNAAAQVSAELSREPAALRQGDAVTVYGFPLNAVLSSGGNLTPGVVSALTGPGNNSGQIQITAPIQPGSSGSPVLNEKGEVVGVVLMKLSDLEMARQTGQLAQNVNFAVSGATLKAFLDTQTVRYETGPLFRFRRSNAEIAEAARKFTFVVECWR